MMLLAVHGASAACQSVKALPRFSDRTKQLTVGRR